MELTDEDVELGLSEGTNTGRVLHHRRNGWGDAIYYHPELDVHRPEGIFRFFETFGRYPHLGDFIHRPTETGYMGEFKVIKVEIQRDPRDQVFALVGLVNRLEKCEGCEWNGKA